MTTVNFGYNNTRRGIRKVSLFAKCRYTRSLIIYIYVLQLLNLRTHFFITVRWDFALGMEILSLFANCCAREFSLILVSIF